MRERSEQSERNRANTAAEHLDGKKQTGKKEGRVELRSLIFATATTPEKWVVGSFATIEPETGGVAFSCLLT